MYKRLIALFGLLILYTHFAFTQKTLDNLCEGAANQIFREIRRSNLPAETKIVFLFFEGYTTNQTNIQTPLGIRISGKLANEIQKKLSRRDIIVLFPVNTQEKLYFSPPSTSQDESNYYNSLNEKISPDYFFEAKYHISSDFSKITLSEMKLKENHYKTSGILKPPISFSNFFADILPSDKNELRHLHLEYSEEDNFMNKILQFSTNSHQLFSSSMLNQMTKQNLTDFQTVFIGNSYVIKLDLQRNAYVYAFFYMPEDKDHPFLVPLFPYEMKQNNFLSAGEHFLPHPSGFDVIPPQGNAHFKIIATEKPLSLTFNSKKNKDGYVDTSLQHHNAEVFYTSLRSAQRHGVPMQTMIMTFPVKYR